MKKTIEQIFDETPANRRRQSMWVRNDSDEFKLAFFTVKPETPKPRISAEERNRRVAAIKDKREMLARSLRQST